jgi:hypothetical protein
VALDQTKAKVAGTGHIWTAPVGTTVAAGVAALSGTWTDAGYTTDGGVTLTQSVSTTDIATWQDVNPIRVLTTGRTIQLAFELEQYEPANVIMAFGGGTLAQTVSLGTVTLPVTGTNASYAVVVDWSDGASNFRWVFPKMQPDGATSLNLQRGALVTMPITLTNLAGSTPEVRSDDAAWHS